MRYEEMKKPVWKRLEYTVVDTITKKEFSNENISLINIDKDGIILNKIDLERPAEYRGLGEYFEVENTQMLNHKLGITITKNIEDMIVIRYNLDKNNDILVNGISINVEENASAKILIYYDTKDESFCYHNGYIKVNAGKNSNLELITLQNMNGNSKNFTQTDFINREDSNVEYYDLELGSGVNAVASKSRLIGDRANMLYVPAYLVDEKRKADFEYSLLFHGKYCNGDIEGRGTTKDYGHKVFRGNIYFYKGCSKSTASEGEFSILLDDTITIHAIPAMLCDEDDVVGAHAASVGKVDEDRLFYLMSRGFSAKEAKKIVVESTFRPIFEKIEIEDIKEEMFEEIKRRML
ncbi:Fe-S cluster assembly protein SufD [Oceanivirga salmonicida]|uniref:Fe-S cluster assembly protein SufD n=1 Tax=Oceanivirga salmonicida TaxID=1769291 RepID=UPI0012E13729|nr:Fe-S cluster assembly protein SufD [Oceanivirga salmonicida]